MSEQSQAARDDFEQPPPRLWVAAENGVRQFASEKSIDQITLLRWFANPRTLKSKFGWQAKQGTPKQFLEDCCGIGKFGHRERETKDGSCFVPAAVEGETRNANAVAAIYTLWLDIDKASMAEVEAVEAELRRHGLGYVLYSTFNHLSPETEVDHERKEELTKRFEEIYARAMQRSTGS
jgi:hypothetical protein